MASAHFLLPLFILIQLLPLSQATSSVPCHPEQAEALLQLKRSILFDYSSTTLHSWRLGTNCCLWEGVGCDRVSGLVTVLDLSGRGLYSYSLDGALFNLTTLQRLDLSLNDFGGSRIPAVGFERLTVLTHLNLSYSGFYGQIPIVIGKLKSLISLDLSSIHYADGGEIDTLYDILDSFNLLLLQEPSFETLISNLTNLRELYLDGVDISSSREDWSRTLGKSVPHLQVLSMAYCGLLGPIHSSMSRLHSLNVINLKGNGISGVVPEFFADFSNLSVLQVSYNQFRRWFPDKIFQLKSLRVLDVSNNNELSGHVPKFRNWSSLETLNLQETSFSGVRLSNIGNLISLGELGLDERSISVEPPYLFANKLDSIHDLQLSLADFSGEVGSFFSWISDLKRLTTLKLSDCYSSKIMPSWIGNLTHLKTLDIRYCGFIGPIPSSIGNLTTLESLTISDSAFSGKLPSSIGNLRNLKFLHISCNGLSGSITPAIGDLDNLAVIILGGCSFSGRIPNVISNMTKLICVDLSQNDLIGDVPTFLFTLPLLLQLDLSSNQLSGPLQEFNTRFSSIEIVALNDNKLSGKIPSSFYWLTNLAQLDLSSNSLAGLVDLSSFWRLRKLTILDLSDNQLYVKDGKDRNSTFPLLPKLSELELKSCSMTEIPRFLMYLYITILDLSCNKIVGTIPKWTWEKWDHSLRSLNLSHNVFTDLQLTSYVLPNSHLESLDLSSNRIQGQIPIPNMLTKVSSSGQVLDYSNNRFTSVMLNFTSYLSQTVYLKMSNNNITGYIPHSICNSSNLDVLDLANNNFSGLVPSCLIEDSHLSILSLRGNHFEGELPYNINSPCNLETIDINGNSIQGQLPKALSKCTYLEVLDIGNNQIVDTFPSWLGSLSNLRVLVLRSNQFYGALDDPIRHAKSQGHFSRLQIIDIAANNFSGNVRPEWLNMFKSMMEKFNETGQIIGHSGSTYYYQDTVALTYKGHYITFQRILTGLTAIDFSNNKLDGVIPGLVGNLISLHILNLSQNAFTGNIPPQLGNMGQLESLDLSSNQLSGEIPQELANLTFLETLDLSNNNFIGRIPQSRQFGTFENSSFEGNIGLCGPPLSRQCGSSTQPKEKQAEMAKDNVDYVLFLFVGIGFGLGFAAAILLKQVPLGKFYRGLSILRR